MLLFAASAAEVFRAGSAPHLAALAACAVLVLAFGRAAKRSVAQGDQAALRRLQAFAGYGCLLVWILNTLYGILTDARGWGRSLPLHYCNLANLIGAVAVLGRNRLGHAVMYFWTVTLCIWAFLTPTLQGGYATADFWIFWAYHLFIPLSLVEIFVVQGFRPGYADLRNAWLFTFAYTALLALLDRAFGWNYGFVGPADPSAPTPIDWLGPYPRRLLWMFVLATALFLAAWLPWRGARLPRNAPIP